jgi:NAD-dependent deacetylase
MLVLGTSLAVFPAASMPQYTVSGGGEIIIVNNMPTPMDALAVFHLEELKEVFEGLNAIMEKG